MNIDGYNKLSYKLCKKLTNAYSTSFSLGIKLFSKEFRNPIYGIYGFVRVADEIVDTFHNYDKRALMAKFREDTLLAINQKISTNPILNSFQKVVNDFNIEWELIDAFLTSMEMDLTENHYNRDNYDKYIYGSAEVVGLMCLRVFTNNNKVQYDKLKFAAKQLGSAFQKVNFLRDIKSDIEERGRIYLPGIDKEIFIDDESKKMLEEEVKKEFFDALQGIKQLPKGVRTGVYTAYLYYNSLFLKITKLNIQQLKKERVRVPDYKKLFLMIRAFVSL
ncbi:MAG TPA: phytoene/squalene synthase family protein [Melioribacteraceae bacterium]|mgnify:CR=1 FL=1|nr:phytoene/squalene synthase family protein [Melioribacteraceae bacterium]